VIATHVDDKKQRSWIVGKFDFQTYVITWGVATAYVFFFGILGRRRKEMGERERGEGRVERGERGEGRGEQRGE
jgi:hypothetical protein